jgi:hypothetical protein
MPKVSVSDYVDVELNTEIDVSDFIEECSENEIKEIIDILVNDGWIKGEKVISGSKTLLEHEIRECITKIEKNLIQLTVEEEELLKKIANRF